MSEDSDTPFVSTAVRWGIILGGAVAVWTMGVHLAGFYTTRVRYAQTADIAATILPVVCVGAAILRLDDGHRSLTFVKALLAGAVIGVVSALITVPFLWFYHHAVNPHWVDYLVDYEQRRAADRGLSETDLSARILTLQRGATDRAQIVGGIVGSTVFSVLLSGGWFLVLLVRHRIAGHGRASPDH